MQPDADSRFAAQLPKNLWANMAYFLVIIRTGNPLVLHPVQTLGNCISHIRISELYRSSPFNPRYKGMMVGIFKKYSYYYLIHSTLQYQLAGVKPSEVTHE